MSPAFAGAPTGLGKFRTKVPATDCQGNALSFVELIDSNVPHSVLTGEYCSQFLPWINSIHIYTT